MHEEYLDSLEHKILDKYKKTKDFQNMNYFKFIDIIDKSVFLQNDRVNAEKLKGRFIVNISKNLPSPLRIS